MAKKRSKPQVFISHSSIDTWVARQIAHHVEECGAACFLDEADIQAGDDFEAEIIRAAETSSELLVLLTPWATTRPYIWLEMGSFWTRKKRIVGVLHGLTAKNISVDPNIPAILKKTDLLTLNEIERYFSELKARAASWGARK